MNPQWHKFVEHVVAPIKQRIMMAIARCVIDAITDSDGLQRVRLSVFADETLNDVERVQQYGLTSNPPAGSEGVVLFPFGSRDHGVLIAVDHRTSRKKNLASGEVAIYTDEGDYVLFKRGRIVEITTQTLEVNATTITLNASTAATINAPVTTITGALAAGTGSDGGNATIYGDVISTSVGTSLQELKTTYNSHTHNEHGTGGGVTDPPNESV